MSTTTTDPLAELRAQIAALTAELRASKVAAQGGDDAWARKFTAVGHPDARLFASNAEADEAGANPHQVRYTGEELEDLVLAIDARLKKLEGKGT